MGGEVLPFEIKGTSRFVSHLSSQCSHLYNEGNSICLTGLLKWLKDRMCVKVMWEWPGTVCSELWS